MVDEAVHMAAKLFDGEIALTNMVLPDTPGRRNADLESMTYDDGIRHILILALDASGWVQKEAAARLEISQHRILEYIKKYKINPPNGAQTLWRKNK